MKKNLKTTTFKTGSAILISMGLLAAFPSSVIARTMATSISQQSIQVKGTITDSSGEPVIGATIKVKGQTTGTITDLDGHFTLQASKGATLVISYIGYQTQEVIVSSNTMEIKMEEDAESLEEVVVVGYGTMKKKDLTGSIAQVRPDKLANEAPTSVQDVLRGTAGLNVGFSNEAKGGGSMTLRGQRSVYSSGDHNAPLIILDGMQFYGELSEINPNDIEQIDILKDASSAAVYGAKAANGVVLITTKKGKDSKPTINFAADWGISTIGDIRNVYNATDYLKYRQDFYRSETYGTHPQTGNYEAYQKGKAVGYYEEPTAANLAAYGLSLEEWRAMTTQDASMSDREIWGRRLGLAASNMTLENFINNKTFDWKDQSFRTGVNQNYNVSVSGSTGKTNYYFSLGYMNQ